MKKTFLKMLFSLIAIGLFVTFLLALVSTAPFLLLIPFGQFQFENVADVVMYFIYIFTFSFLLDKIIAPLKGFLKEGVDATLSISVIFFVAHFMQTVTITPFGAAFVAIVTRFIEGRVEIQKIDADQLMK